MADGTKSGEGPQVRLVRGQEVGLGCSTLIVIGVMVWLLSGKGVRDLEVEVFSLRSEVKQLKTAVEAQTAEIQQLRDRLPSPPKTGVEKR